CEVGSWTYWIYVYFFFFPAEDGIRDFHVTGVQTCALPISMPVELRARSFDHFLLNPPFHAAGTVTSAGDAGRRTALAEGAAGLRSEERRVGEEGSGGRPTENYKKTTASDDQTRTSMENRNK